MKINETEKISSANEPRKMKIVIPDIFEKSEYLITIEANKYIELKKRTNYYKNETVKYRKATITLALTSAILASALAYTVVKSNNDNQINKETTVSNATNKTYILK